jgi:hypothetical protein
MSFFLLLVSAGFGQARKQSECRKSWTFPGAKTTISGVVVRFIPMADCGNFVTATMCIVKADIGDTIRLLQLCDTTKKLARGTKVTCLVAPQTEFPNPLLPSDPKTDCRIRITYFGSLRLK